MRTAYRRMEGAVTYAYTYLTSPVLLVRTSLGMDMCLLGMDGSLCNQLFTRENGDAATLHSLEANLRAYLLWGFSAFASVAYTHALAATSPDSPLPRVPPVHGVAALEFRRPRTIFSFIQLMMRWAGPQRRLSAEDLFDPTICLASTRCGGTPGFVMVSLRSALRLSRQIQLTAAIDNITNESYRFHGSGLNGPGIGARLGLDANY